MLYGTSYYPLHYQETDYHADFKKMKQLGFNCIRTAELICSWDWLEKEEGKIDFSSIDIIFELADQYQMQVILGTGSCSPPAWLLKKYADIRIKDRDLVEYPLNGMWGGGSIFHPEYIKAHQNYLYQLLEKYKSKKALYGWQIHNEAGYPFVHKIGKSRSFFDYSKYALIHFKTWLEKKYKNTQTLFEAWRWTPSNQGYARFDDVEAPTLTAAEWGSPMAWQDWILFHTESWTSFIQSQNNIIKNQTQNQPTIINFYGRGIDWDASGCIDPVAICEHVDIVGYDMYPSLLSHKTATLLSHYVNTQFLIDFYASISSYLNKPLFLPEVESGPIGDFFQGPKHYTTKSDILKYFATALSRNCQSFLFQAYREWEALPLHWGAIVNFINQNTERTHAAAEIGKFIVENEEIFEAKPLQPQIEIVYDYNNIIAFSNTQEHEIYQQSLLNIYQTLSFAGYQIGLIDINYINQSKAKCVIFPRYLLSDNTMIEKLNYLNSKTISIICFAKTAFVDQAFKRYRKQPGANLDQFFALEEIKIENKEQDFLVWQKQTIQLRKHLKQQCKITKNNAKIAGQFEDQSAALIKSQNQKTVNLYFTFDLDNLLQHENDELQNYFVHQIQEQLKIEPIYPASNEVETRILRNNNYIYYIITNRILGNHTIEQCVLKLPKMLANRNIVKQSTSDVALKYQIENNQLKINGLQSSLVLLFEDELGKNTKSRTRISEKR